MCSLSVWDLFFSQNPQFWNVFPGKNINQEWKETNEIELAQANFYVHYFLYVHRYLMPIWVFEAFCQNFHFFQMWVVVFFHKKVLIQKWKEKQNNETELPYPISIEQKIAWKY